MQSDMDRRHPRMDRDGERRSFRQSGREASEHRRDISCQHQKRIKVSPSTLVISKARKELAESYKLTMTPACETCDAGILHGIRRDAEFLEGHVAVVWVEEDVPVLVAHDELAGEVVCDGVCLRKLLVGWSFRRV